MATLSLSDVQNDYGSYRGNSLIGLLGAAVTVPNDGLSGIIGKPYPFLNGILINIDGSIYTDSGYLNKLKVLGNPYISKRSLPMVKLTLSSLTAETPDIKVHDDNGGTYRTQYSESTITKRMNTVDDILRYLNDFFNPSTTETVIDPNVLGSFSLQTTSYSAELDVKGIYPGLEFETLEDIAVATTVKISTPPSAVEEKQPEPIVEQTVEPEKELNVVIPPKIFDTIKIPPLDDFLLNDSIEFSREILETPRGLRDTGLRDAYDTGDYGPMADILDKLANQGGQGSYDGTISNGFGGFTI